MNCLSQESDSIKSKKNEKWREIKEKMIETERQGKKGDEWKRERERKRKRKRMGEKE